MKSYKVKSLFEKISENSAKIHYSPRQISVDESMVPYKGKSSSILQYLPVKPQKWVLNSGCVVIPLDILIKL